MPGEEPLRPRESPVSDGPHARLQGADAVHEEERRTVRKHVPGRRTIAHFPRAFRRFVGVSAGEILYHASRMTPSLMRNADL
jgi:hypothetical protein